MASKNYIKFKVAFHGINFPSYPKGNSDHRISLHNLVNNGIKTLPFYSDDDALKITASINNLSTLETDSPTIQFTYSKTKWNRFKTTATRNIRILDIPHDRNMHNTEIDTGLDELDTAIKQTISASVHRIKPINTSDININKKIIKLQKK